VDVADLEDDGLDDDGLDVTPRPPEERRRTRRRRNPAAYGALALIVVAIGFVLFQGLNNAALYYRNADEAVHDKASLGTRRFRIQGTVQPGLTKSGEQVDFTIAFNNVSVPVRHTGDPPDLFKEGLPVVLEGHWSADGTFFASDRILVKHSEEYKAANPDHVSSGGP
jgi:cytochrome c-type biogenesis protein CcmE